jgi:hypothetical protein
MLYTSAGKRGFVRLINRMYSTPNVKGFVLIGRRGPLNLCRGWRSPPPSINNTEDLFFPLSLALLLRLKLYNMDSSSLFNVKVCKRALLTARICPKS